MRRLTRQLPLFLWLIVVWAVLWGRLDAVTLLGGVVVAAIVTGFFALLPAETPGRFNVVRFAVLVAVFAFDLARGSFEVAWIAVRPRPLTRSSIIQVDLRTHSDLVMTLTAEAVTLVPGSFVTELDRDKTVLYLHVLDADTDEKTEAMRRRVFAQEERIIRALGSRGDLARLESWKRSRPGGPGSARTAVRPGRIPR